jgi:hypothetical protein
VEGQASLTLGNVVVPWQAAFWNNTIFARLASQPLQAFAFNASTMQLVKAYQGNSKRKPAFMNFHGGILLLIV